MRERVFVLCIVLLALCRSTAAAPKIENADDLLVVDCLLPAKVRRLGTRSTYLAPRLPLRTTAVDCRIRGGEYTQPDQANYQTSLRVWLPQAEAGDAEAQYFVGQIYEKGLGTDPDYLQAAEWYRKAADNAYTPAMVNLAYLYEEGLGVGQDPVAALDLYRRAAGASESLVMLEQSDYSELLRLKSEAETRAAEVAKLEREVGELGSQLAALRTEATEEGGRVAVLESLLGRLQVELRTREVELEQSRVRVAAVEKARSQSSDSWTSSSATKHASPSDAPAEPQSSGKAAARGDLDFGSYYALVIGNTEYHDLPRVEGARVDAERVAKTLERLYGFEVELLLDATRFDTMKALNRLRESLNEKDNLLVYYAGHGLRDENRNTAYWQPVDASASSPANWIPDGVLADHLDLIPAKHVMVVADSAFSGMRTRSSIARLPQGRSSESRYYHIRQLLDRRARLVLASGGRSARSSGSSRFADLFIDVLESNHDVLEASRVHLELSERMSAAGAGEPPQFATLRWTRNDVSDFFFVPKAR